MAAFTRHITGPGRARTAARFALFLESSARPELRAPLSRGRETVLAWSAAWVRRFGSSDPERHGRILLDHLDGVVLHQLAFPVEDFDPAPDIRQLLTGLLG